VTAADLSPPDPGAPIAACVAGLRTALADASAAVERWCDENLEAMAFALDDSGKALARARRMAADVCTVIPSHSRHARLVRRAVEQVEEAIRVVERARVWDWSDEEPEVDIAMLAAMRRGLATAHRAVDAAEG
jgi:hypothetical protein